MSVPPLLRHNQQVPRQSVSPNVNSSVFQQIITGLNGAEPEEDRIVAITKVVLKLMKHISTRKRTLD
jgi:hypothetical protein